MKTTQKGKGENPNKDFRIKLTEMRARARARVRILRASTRDREEEMGAVPTEKGEQLSYNSLPNNFLFFLFYFSSMEFQKKKKVISNTFNKFIYR